MAASPDAKPPGGGRLSTLDATLLVMGGILGVGIFFTPQAVAERVPEAWAFFCVWAFGGAIAVCAAFTFAELGASFPRSGGWFVFLHEIYGRFVAFLFAWVVLFVVSTGATAAMTVFCAEMLHRALPELFPGPGSSGHRAVAAAIVLAVTGVTMCGVRRGALLQNLCMVLKLLAVAALLVAGFTLLEAPADAADAAMDAGASSGSRSLLGGMIAALLPVFFSCGGWQMVCYIAPEIRDPARTLPRAIVVGVLGVVLLYLLLNLAFLRGLGLEGVAADTGFAAELARRAFGPAGERWLAAGMAVSALGVVAVTIIASPWIYVAMAREGLFFRSFARLHSRTGAPRLALAVQAAVTLVYLYASGLAFLVDSVVFVEWIFHGLVAMGLILVRRTRPDLPRPFRSPAFPAAPLVYFLAALVVVGGNLWQAELSLKLSGLGTVAVGALVYLPWRARAGA